MTSQNKQKKVNLVEKLTSELESASALVLVNYAGLGVKAQQSLKKSLKAANAKMVVVKNTLLKIAGEKSKLAEEFMSDTALSGPTALIITKEDPIAPIQAVAKFAKEFELPHLKVGIVEGKFQDKASLEKLSTLPSKDVLTAQVVGAVRAPLYGLVGTLNGNLQKLVWILQAKTEASNS